MRDSSTARLRRVVEIRDASLALMQSQGRWSGTFSVDGVAWLIRVASIGALRVSLRIPFTPPPKLSDQVRYVAAVPAKKVEHRYGLDIWAPRKVMNLEWSQPDDILVVSFRRGAWEQKIIDAAASIELQSA